VAFAFILLAIYIWALVIDLLAPTFGGRRHMLSALKLAVFSATPALLAGILALIPSLGMLQLIAAIYGIYVLYLGFPVLMRSAPERSAGYTAATVVGGIVVGMGFAALMAVFNMGAFGGLGRYTSDAAGRAAGEKAVANVLGAVGGGSPEAKGAAAASLIGSMVGGGKASVEPVDFHVLEGLLPAAAGGLDRTNTSGEQSAIGGLRVSSAEGGYDAGRGPRLTIKISDLANASGMMALGRMAFSVESERDAAFEKNVTLGGQKVHEKWRASDRSSELISFVGNRFMVEVNGHGLDIPAAEQAFTSIDLGKLASSK
jgi:hypothetical protein